MDYALACLVMYMPALRDKSPARAGPISMPAARLANGDFVSMYRWNDHSRQPDTVVLLIKPWRLSILSYMTDI
jgi:hypothetical protein